MGPKNLSPGTKFSSQMKNSVKGNKNSAETTFIMRKEDDAADSHDFNDPIETQMKSIEKREDEEDKYEYFLVKQDEVSARNTSVAKILTASRAMPVPSTSRMAINSYKTS